MFVKNFELGFQNFEPRAVLMPTWQLLVESSASLQINDQLVKPILDSLNCVHSFPRSCIQYAEIKINTSRQMMIKLMTYDMIAYCISQFVFCYPCIPKSFHFDTDIFFFEWHHRLRRSHCTQHRCSIRSKKLWIGLVLGQNTNYGWISLNKTHDKSAHDKVLYHKYPRIHPIHNCIVRSEEKRILNIFEFSFVILHRMIYYSHSNQSNDIHHADNNHNLESESNQESDDSDQETDSKKKLVMLKNLTKADDS